MLSTTSPVFVWRNLMSVGATTSIWTVCVSENEPLIEYEMLARPGMAPVTYTVPDGMPMIWPPLITYMLTVTEELAAPVGLPFSSTRWSFMTFDGFPSSSRTLIVAVRVA